jgi:hypothetical protein
MKMPPEVTARMRGAPDVIGKTGVLRRGEVV